MNACRLIFGGALALLSLAARGATEAAHIWPDAPPVVLREDIFGIRFQLVLSDRGPKAADKFLREAMAKSLSSEATTHAAWVSLFSEAWGMQPILPEGASEPLLRSAIKEGSALAADVLGRAMLYGSGGISRDIEEGMRLLDLGVERGLPRAIARRGVHWATGFGGRQDVEWGESEVRRAAALGVGFGLEELAEAFESGRIGNAPDLARALDYYYLSALENDGRGWGKLQEHEDKGTPGARLLNALAKVRFANEGGFIVPSAVRKYIAVLEKSGSADPRVAVELGVARLFGVDWVKRDVKRAKDYFTQAAEAGNEEARFFLAYMRLRGLAGPKDTEAALAEMTAMAETGNVRAAARLGYYYYWGAGEAGDLRKDPAKAFHYTGLAAEAGSLMAVLNLAHCYKHAIGTKENPVLAARLYWIATQKGVSGAKEDLMRQLSFAKVP